MSEEVKTVQEKGNLSIHTENIFPIIKRFLYSDNEIFLRELVSNAVDATNKLKSLASMGKYGGELGELKVAVKLDKENESLKDKLATMEEILGGEISIVELQRLVADAAERKKLIRKNEELAKKNKE